MGRSTPPCGWRNPWIRSRFEPLIICPEEGDLPRLARLSGLKVEIVPRPKFPSVSVLWGKRYIADPFGFLLTAINVFRAMQNLHKALREYAVDIVLTKGLLAHFYGGWAARRLQIPCVWYVQEEVDAKRGGGLYRSILNWGTQKIPNRVIVDATALLEQFGSQAKMPEGVKVIYNGIDTQQFTLFSQSDRQAARKSFDFPTDATVMGQTGRLIPLKGQATLLQAFTSLSRHFPDIHLLFVGAPLFGGQGYEQKLRLQAAQWGLADRVHFSGFIPDVRRGLAAMDIFVHASLETDSPLGVMEAMSCGLPVIVSGVRGTLEMVKPNVNALVFEPGNPDALALELAKLLKSRTMQKDLGKQARAAIMEKFSLPASVAQLQTLLESVHAA